MIPALVSGSIVSPLASDAERLIRILRPGTTVVAALEPGIPGHVLTELSALKELREDWDGLGAPKVSREAIEGAMYTLLDLFRMAKGLGMELPTPKVMAGGDGSAGLRWRHAVKDSDVELSFFDGNVELFAWKDGQEASDLPTRPHAYDVLALIQRHILTA